MTETAVPSAAKAAPVMFPPRKPFGKEEIKNVVAAIKSQNLFAMNGVMAKQFEREFAAYYGVNHAVMVNSGTAALHAAVAALNLEPGSEVITVPVTDLGTVIGILFQGCIPIFADWQPGAINVDPEDIERKITAKTRAVIVVHLGGNPCAMDAILAICRRHQLPLIEDCCQAYLAEYRGQWVGTLGDIGCFSMQQSKHLTAGEGGVVITRNDALAERMALFRDKGWERWKEGPRNYSMLGMNYRPNELTAAVALAQLKKLAGVVAKRRQLGDLLTALIRDVPGIAIPRFAEGAAGSYWFYAFFTTGFDLHEFAGALQKEGMPVGAGYTGKPIYLCSEVFTQKRTFGNSGYPFNSPYYGKPIEYRPGLCPVAEAALGRMAHIWFSESWRQRDIRALAGAIRKVAAALTAKTSGGLDLSGNQRV